MSPTPSTDLEPADLERCQCETTQRTPFALGGTHKVTRCDNKAIWLATENNPGKDGKIGSMSLCDTCIDEFTKQLGPNYATLTRIKAKK